MILGPYVLIVPLLAMKFPPLFVSECMQHTLDKLVLGRSETHMLNGMLCQERHLFKHSCDDLEFILQGSTHKRKTNLLLRQPVAMPWISKVDVLTEVALKLEFLNKILLHKIQRN